jgi:hypothetical protein
MLISVSSELFGSSSRSVGSWSTAMATVTYRIEVMYEGQQWIVDQIQKVNVKAIG